MEGDGIGMALLAHGREGIVRRGAAYRDFFGGTGIARHFDRAAFEEYEVGLLAADGYDGGEAARLGADFLEFKPAVGQFDRVEQGVVALVGLKEKEFHQGAFGKARGCAADGGGHALGLGAEHGERQQESKANLFHWFGI